MNDAGETRRELRIKRDDLWNIPVDLLNQRHVLHQIVVDFRLVILVDLLNQRAVPVKHRLDLPEIAREGAPDRRISAFLETRVAVEVVAFERVGGGEKAGGFGGVAVAVAVVGGVVVHGWFSGAGGDDGGVRRLHSWKGEMLFLAFLLIPRGFGYLADQMRLGRWVT